MAELRTPLSAWHEEHGAKMAPFAGWWMPIQYEGILAEHRHTRAHAGLFDICHMGEFRIEGPGAGDALSRALSHNLETLREGRARYGFLLNEKGGILDDCVLYRFGPNAFMLVVNAACSEQDFATLAGRLSKAEVDLVDDSALLGKIDLQGPESLDVLEKILQRDFHALGYFSFTTCRHAGHELVVSRTGYTGEYGFELYYPADAVPDLWKALLEDTRVKACGLGARDTLRLEAGLPLYGNDLDAGHTPAEAGMERLLTNPADYVGKAGAHTVRERLIPLNIEGRRSAHPGNAVALPSGAPVGRVTSASFAPSLGHAIAFAWVAPDSAGAEDFILHTERGDLSARRTDLPFYKEGSVRKKFA